MSKLARLSKVLFLVGLICFFTESLYGAQFVVFRIDVDGKRAFQGGTGRVPGEPYIDVLRLKVPRAGIRLAENSPVARDTTGDVNLQGDIVFSFGDLPDMRLTHLRLIYDREDRRGMYIDGFYYDWKLHPDDAATIVAYYKGFEKRGSFSPRSLTALFALPLIAIALVWGTVRVLCVIAKSKKTRTALGDRETLSGL